jgi:asparagine synthase (glutamine-hydrolysing)
MCGTIGFVDKCGAFGDGEKKALIGRMIDSIEHRGRDGACYFIDGPVVIGNVRLSILDTSARGAQPFFDASHQVVVSYNGEIYNYHDVNRLLEKRYDFRSSCDTETLVYAYRDDPEGFLDGLFGMFAFSLLDRSRKKLVLAADRFAIKPLYYIDTNEWFAWSSEAKSLFELPGFKAELLADALSEHMVFRHVAGARTLFKNVKRVLPRQMISYDVKSGARSEKTYWEPGTYKTGWKNDRMEFLNLLGRSVAEHLLADVPVGLQLSGGIDSSLVTAMASRGKRGLHTYSIGLEDCAWNEFRYSRKVAEQFRTQHHELIFTEHEFARLLPILTYYHDEPLSHSHSIPMYILANRARKDVKALLSGEGADEIFLGYNRHQKLFASGEPDEGAILLSTAFNSIKDAASVLTCFDQSDEAFSYRWSALRAAKGQDAGRRVSDYDTLTYLTPLLLRQDKMGMAANLENRVPFLDHRVVEFGYSLPCARKLGMSGKNILKEIASEFLPKDLVYRPKCGFGQPISEWLKNQEGLGSYLRLFRNGVGPTYIQYEAAQSLAAEHARGRADHGDLLWTLLTLEVWMRIFVRRQTPSEILDSLA